MTPERLLIVRADRIGDLMHVTPVLHALHEQHPAVAVDVLGRNPALGVLAGNPAVRMTLDAGWDDARLAAAIAEGRYDAVVHLFPDKRLSALCSAIPRSVRNGWFAWGGERGRVVVHRSRSAKSEALYNADFVLPLFPGLQVDPRPRVYPSVEARAQAAQIAPQPRVLLNPGSGHPEGAWPPERFVAVARALAPPLGPALVLWGPGEEELAWRVAEEGGAHMAPLTDLTLLAALAERASVVVSNDTGPMHIAAAAGAPLVTIWDGSAVIRPLRWGHSFRPDIVNLDPFDGSGDRPTERQRRLASVTAELVAAKALEIARCGPPAGVAT